jgi:hypothetical protein
MKKIGFLIWASAGLISLTLGTGREVLSVMGAYTSPPSRFFLEEEDGGRLVSAEAHMTPPPAPTNAGIDDLVPPGLHSIPESSYFFLYSYLTEKEQNQLRLAEKAALKALAEVRIQGPLSWEKLTHFLRQDSFFQVFDRDFQKNPKESLSKILPQDSLAFWKRGFFVKFGPHHREFLERLPHEKLFEILPKEILLWNSPILQHLNASLTAFFRTLRERNLEFFESYLIPCGDLIEWDSKFLSFFGPFEREFLDMIPEEKLEKSLSKKFHWDCRFFLNFGPDQMSFLERFSSQKLIKIFSSSLYSNRSLDWNQEVFSRLTHHHIAFFEKFQTFKLFDSIVPPSPLDFGSKFMLHLGGPHMVFLEMLPKKIFLKILSSPPFSWDHCFLSSLNTHHIRFFQKLKTLGGFDSIVPQKAPDWDSPFFDAFGPVHIEFLELMGEKKIVSLLPLKFRMLDVKVLAPFFSEGASQVEKHKALWALHQNKEVMKLLEQKIHEGPRVSFGDLTKNF